MLEKYKTERGILSRKARKSGCEIHNERRGGVETKAHVNYAYSSPQSHDTYSIKSANANLNVFLSVFTISVLYAD